MGRLSRWQTATPFPQGLAYWRRVLARGTLLALTLGAFGLLITSLVATSASASAREAQAAVIPSHQPKPTRTPHKPTPPGEVTPSPTPPATSTPSPTPPATVVPNPTPPATSAPSSTPPATSVPDPTATPSAATATMPPTAVATGTANPGGGGGDLAGLGNDRTPGAGGPSDLLVLGPVTLALLAFSVFIVLEARRATRKERQRALASSTQNPAHAQLNQSHQGPPIQKIASPRSAEDTAGRARKKGHTQHPLLPPQETSPAPIPPPRWLIDAGLLPQNLGEFPSEDTQGP